MFYDSWTAVKPAARIPFVTECAPAHNSSESISEPPNAATPRRTGISARGIIPERRTRSENVTRGGSICMDSSGAIDGLTGSPSPGAGSAIGSWSSGATDGLAIGSWSSMLSSRSLVLGESGPLSSDMLSESELNIFAGVQKTCSLCLKWLRRPYLEEHAYAV